MLSTTSCCLFITILQVHFRTGYSRALEEKQTAQNQKHWASPIPQDVHNFRTQNDHKFGYHVVSPSQYIPVTIHLKLMIPFFGKAYAIIHKLQVEVAFSWGKKNTFPDIGISENNVPQEFAGLSSLSPFELKLIWVHEHGVAHVNLMVDFGGSSLSQHLT